MKKGELEKVNLIFWPRARKADTVRFELTTKSNRFQDDRIKPLYHMSSLLFPETSLSSFIINLLNPSRPSSDVYHQPAVGYLPITSPPLRPCRPALWALGDRVPSHP